MSGPNEPHIDLMKREASSMLSLLRQGYDSHFSMMERAQSDSLNPKPRFAIRIRTGDLSISGHPVVCVRYSLFGGK